MRRLLRTLFTLLAVATLCVCCAPHAPPVAYPPLDAPAAILTLHGDTSFTGHQRALVETAMRRLNDETHGLLVVQVAWDLNFDDMSSIAEHATDDALLRVESTDDVVQSIEMAPGSMLLGLTSIGRPPLSPDAVTVVLVTDRLTDDTLFTSVAMHELLHAFGLDHVRDPEALMYWSVSSFPTTCMHEADVDELCRVYGCNPTIIGWCE